MTAAEIARALGPTRRSGSWWRCVCPVHGSRTGRSLTLALQDGEHGLIAVCHAGCDRLVVRGELGRRGLLRGQKEADSGIFHSHVAREFKKGSANSVRTRQAYAIWNATREPFATPLGGYLAGRGIVVLPVPCALRWAHALRRMDGEHAPAMVARVEDIDGRLIGVHRTWLDQDVAGCWQRRDRASLGPIRGGAVRLAPARDLLMVGEGIETALSAMQATGFPAWAALSTSGLVSLILPPLPLAATVVILADNDRNGAGERAARSAAARWLTEGRRVRLAMPPEPGTDFNDVLLGRMQIAMAEARNGT